MSIINRIAEPSRCVARLPRGTQVRGVHNNGAAAVGPHSYSGGRSLNMLAQKLTEPRPVAPDARLPKILELVSLTLDQPHFQQAASALATKLAVELSCSRVSIGFLRGRFITVRALSHSASHGVKTSLLRGIAAAMEEAIDQDVVLVCPGGEHVNIAHRKLMEQNRDTAVCSIPLVSDKRIIGALRDRKSVV